MFNLSREIVNAITACIRAVLTKCLHELRDENEEVWLSKDEFLKQFGMFTEDWLKRYGKMLGRTQAIVTDDNGEQRCSRWAYPRNKVQRMILDGSIKQLKVSGVME